MGIIKVIDELHDQIYKETGKTGLQASNVLVPVLLTLRHEAEMPKYAGIAEDALLPKAASAVLSNSKQKVAKTLQWYSDRFRKRLDLQIIFSGLKAEVDGVAAAKFNSIFKHIKKKAETPEYPSTLKEVDFLGTLFEKTVSTAFTGSNGQFFTPKNIILLVVEMMSILEKTTLQNDMSQYTVCDPCCGSARFLIFWSGRMIDDYKSRKGFGAVVSPEIRKELQGQLSKIAQSQLFGVDIEPQIAKYAALNMMMNGDGSSNIQNADSLDHFGYLAEWPQIYRLINKFLAKYTELKQRLGRSHTEIFRELDDILPILQELSNLSGMNATLDLRSEAFQTLYRFLEILSDRELLGDTAHKFKEWDEICRNKGMQPIRDLMIHVWSAANADIQNGFDVIITNPPFGRSKGLTINDPHILCQYKLATELWIGSATKIQMKKIISKKGLNIKMNNKSNDKLREEILQSLNGQEWFTVDEVENPANKVTLIDGDYRHTIHHDSNGDPILFKKNVPKQILFIEQFLRMAKPGGKVFTVLDTGVLSNLEDEYVRRFMFREARIHSVVEFPHGAFKAANANVKTAVVLLEKARIDPNEDYEIFGALPMRMGYLTNKQTTPLTKQNDMGIVLCDYYAHLDKKRLCNDEKRYSEPEGWKKFIEKEGDACKGLTIGYCPHWQENVGKDDLSGVIDLEADAMPESKDE